MIGLAHGTLWSLSPPPYPPRPAPVHARHADPQLAAFEQGDWLAELELLQLGEALHRQAVLRRDSPAASSATFLRFTIPLSSSLSDSGAIAP